MRERGVRRGDFSTWALGQFLRLETRGPNRWVKKKKENTLEVSKLEKKTLPNNCLRSFQCLFVYVYVYSTICNASWFTVNRVDAI